MSLNNSTMPSNLSHGTTNTGSGPRVLPSDHKFSGEKDAAYWRTQMVEVVLKEAMAKVGMRMEWFEKKQTPNMKLYQPDISVPITTKDAQALDRKIEEIKEKEIKALGVLMEHIEPHSRAWAVVGQEAFSRGDPVEIFGILQRHFQADSVSGMCDLIDRYLEEGHEAEDLLAFLNRKYKELSEFSRFNQSEITKRNGRKGVRSPHGLSEVHKTLLVFQLARKIPRFAQELQDFMVDNILGLEFNDPELSFEKLYGKLVKWLKNRESIGLGPKVKVESAVFTAEFEKKMMNKLRNMKRKELKREYRDNQALHRLNTSDQNYDATGSVSFTGVKRKVWHCENCGDQTDHSTRFCPKVLAERPHPDSKKRTGCILNQHPDVKEEKDDAEVNYIQALNERKFDFAY
jgi:hypothetical protein